MAIIYQVWAPTYESKTSIKANAAPRNRHRVNCEQPFRGNACQIYEVAVRYASLVSGTVAPGCISGHGGWRL